MRLFKSILTFDKQFVNILKKTNHKGTKMSYVKMVILMLQSIDFSTHFFPECIESRLSHNKIIHCISVQDRDRWREI